MHSIHFARTKVKVIADICMHISYMDIVKVDSCILFISFFMLHWISTKSYFLVHCCESRDIRVASTHFLLTKNFCQRAYLNEFLDNMLKVNFINISIQIKR